MHISVRLHIRGQVCHDHVCVNECAWQGVRARKCVLMCCPDLRTKPHARKDVRVKFDLCAGGRVHKERSAHVECVRSCNLVGLATLEAQNL